MTKLTNEELRNAALKLNPHMYGCTYNSIQHATEKVRSAIRTLREAGPYETIDPKNGSLSETHLNNYIDPKHSTDDFLVYAPIKGMSVYAFGELVLAVAKKTQMPVISLVNNVPIYVTSDTKNMSDFAEQYKMEYKRLSSFSAQNRKKDISRNSKILHSGLER